MATVTDVLQRMRELSIRRRRTVQRRRRPRQPSTTEFQQLSAEITRIAPADQVQRRAAIVGSGAGARTFQVGANNGDTMTITTSTVATATGNIRWPPPARPRPRWPTIDAQLDAITTSRATYGAAMSRFEFAISNLQITGENQSAARGRIMDADFAAETANLSRSQILQQAGTAMVAQANQVPQQVLQLLKG